MEAADLVEVFTNDKSGEQFHQSGTHSRSVWSMYLVRVHVEDRGLGNPRVLRKVIIIRGRYGDYVKEIQASLKLVVSCLPNSI